MSATWQPGHIPPPDIPDSPPDHRVDWSRRRRRSTAPPASRSSGLPKTRLDGVGPGSIEVAPRFLRLGDGYAATLAVTAYPDEVFAGWLEPVLAHPGQIDIAMHVEPVPAGVAADRFRYANKSDSYLLFRRITTVACT